MCEQRYACVMAPFRFSINTAFVLLLIYPQMLNWPANQKTVISLGAGY